MLNFFVDVSAMTMMLFCGRRRSELLLVPMLRISAPTGILPARRLSRSFIAFLRSNTDRTPYIKNPFPCYSGAKFDRKAGGVYAGTDHKTGVAALFGRNLRTGRKPIWKG